MYVANLLMLLLPYAPFYFMTLLPLSFSKSFMNYSYPFLCGF